MSGYYYYVRVCMYVCIRMYGLAAQIAYSFSLVCIYVFVYVVANCYNVSRHYQWHLYHVH